MILGKRYELHTHTLLSDGVLLLSEHVRRAENMGLEAIAITDHADISNIDFILESINRFKEKEEKYYNIRIVSGVELTHIPPELIDELALYSKKNGAEIVIVHGETIVEPVIKGTNEYALRSKNVDILAHPGLITEEEVCLARDNNIFLELSSRKGHSLGNGRVAKLSIKLGADMLVNADAHAPGDFITQEFAYKVAIGSGLTHEEAIKVIRDNPIKLFSRNNII